MNKYTKISPYHQRKYLDLIISIAEALDTILKVLGVDMSLSYEDALAIICLTGQGEHSGFVSSSYIQRRRLK